MRLRWFNLLNLLRITLITLTKFLCLTWLLIIFFRNGLIIIFNQILLLNRYRRNLSSTASSSLGKFWFHALIFFLAWLKLSSWFRSFVNIISDQSMVITFVILFLRIFVRSVLTSLWLAFNVSCTSAGKTFLNVTGSRLISFHRLGPLLNALRQFETSLWNFILI